jgi:hypothetical protein
MIHEQVKMQLEYLKGWVEAEKEMERRCDMWGIPYTPSRRKWEDIDNYEKYKREVEQNGDKNLLVMVRLKGGYVNMYGVYPFARRYVHEEYLVYRFPNGGELLLKENEVEIVKNV